MSETSQRWACWAVGNLTLIVTAALAIPALARTLDVPFGHALVFGAVGMMFGFLGGSLNEATSKRAA